MLLGTLLVHSMTNSKPTILGKMMQFSYSNCDLITARRNHCIIICIYPYTFKKIPNATLHQLFQRRRISHWLGKSDLQFSLKKTFSQTSNLLTSLCTFRTCSFGLSMIMLRVVSSEIFWRQLSCSRYPKKQITH